MSAQVYNLEEFRKRKQKEKQNKETRDKILSEIWSRVMGRQVEFRPDPSLEDWGFRIGDE
jgi:hypothetical protein